MSDDVEKQWVKANLDDVGDFLLVRQPMSFLGFSEAGQRRFEEILRKYVSIADSVVCHCPVDEILVRNGARGFAGNAWRHVFRELCGEDDIGSMYSNNSFLHGFNSAREKMNKEVVLSITGYERLLSLPREERQMFTDGLFVFCDADGPDKYHTSTLIFSRCPIWWCEYEADPSTTSVLYQRTTDFVVQKPVKKDLEVVVSEIPEVVRVDFVDKVNFRMERYV